MFHYHSILIEITTSIGDLAKFRQLSNLIATKACTIPSIKCSFTLPFPMPDKALHLCAFLQSDGPIVNQFVEILKLFGNVKSSLTFTPKPRKVEQRKENETFQQLFVGMREVMFPVEGKLWYPWIKSNIKPVLKQYNE